MDRSELDAKVAEIESYLSTLHPSQREAVVKTMRRSFDLRVEARGHVVAAEAAIRARDRDTARKHVEAVNATVKERDGLAEWLAAAGVKSDEPGTLDALDGERLLACLDLDIVLTEHGVSPQLEDFVERIGPDGEYAANWAGIEKSAQAIVDDGSEYKCDKAHLLEYIRLVVATQAARTQKETPVDPADIDRLEAATTAYFGRHIQPSGGAVLDDYAGGLVDARERVLVGCGLASILGGKQLDAWLGDIDTFAARAARHEYSLQQARETLEALRLAQPKFFERKAVIDEELARLKAIIARYDRGPAHIEAIEHQWLAHRVNSIMLRRMAGEEDAGALQRNTVTALAAADAYCWSPVTTEAVGEVGRGIPDDCAFTATALGDLAAPGKAGWWWFQEPIPIKTTALDGNEEPVVALLWRREYPTAVDPREPRLWMQTMVLQPIKTPDGETLACYPTAAWIVHDGTVLADLPASLRGGFSNLGFGVGATIRKQGYDAASVTETVDACVWFSRFFIAASMWLRQRIVVETHGGQGVRHAGKRLQREHKLSTRPTVRIIELRRRESVKREASSAPSVGPTRHLTCRFIVPGFTRRQWYPSRGEHAPKYIEPFWKGPADAPLKVGSSIYVVRR